MNETAARESRAAWLLMIVAATILTLTMGVRQSLGLFVMPIHDSSGLSIVSISFALAVGQLMWGVAQPLFGMYADRHGSVGVVRLGGVMLAGGLALAPFLPSQWGLLFTLGLLSAAGAGAGSFSILIGATSRLLPPERRPFAAGFINAGGSFGQFLFAPITQAVIAFAGWAAAMFTLAASALLTLPLARHLRAPPAPADAPPVPAEADPGLGQAVRTAFADRSYWCLHLGFFTCGLHIAFLVTHLPGEVALCGLPASVSAVSLALIGLFNIAGSLTAGALGQRYRMKWLLAAIYASRALMIAIYLVSPRTALTFYVFAAALGFTWLATVPPTAGLVGKLFGTRYLATLFGLTLLSHQIGGFFGAWLGGVTITRFGDYNWMWYADMAFALLAAAANLPIREERPRQQAVAA
ncbi:MFS transporter [Solimonas sp. SE-A11]|uniref:MFS transporter n=1 Tax=Solimonas sp. SE-A11 TaxID=3054954 RepID=UPI00259D16C5|nr:MFS transporter [Solimonas sp. SE-A11]MDM4771297.1 MFS transporter [Solimonas sp. SE-A11]